MYAVYPSMNKKARSKIPLKPKAPFKCGFMDIVPPTAPKILTSDTTFSNYLLIVDAYYKIPKLYGMDKVTTEEVMEKLEGLKFHSSQKHPSSAVLWI